MDRDIEILLKLVRLAIGWENDKSLPENINWNRILDLAYEQGVAAIILDGYAEFLKENPRVGSFLSTPETKPLRGIAFGRLTGIEMNYHTHFEALSSLSELLSKHQIPFLLLKGFSCSQYYPIPNHRGCGDIDIYPGRLYDNSVLVLQSSGIEIDSHYYRHSVFKLRGVNIENHRVLCDLRGPYRQTRAFEKHLEALANDCLDNPNEITINGTTISGVVIPSIEFNSLFLPWHVSAHFEFERVTIRHILDWSLFLSHDGKGINVNSFRLAKKKYTYGFSRVADILTNLAVRYLKMPVTNIPDAIIEDAMTINNRLADRFFDYMFIGKPRERDSRLWKSRFNNAKRIFHDRWKYKDIYQMSFFRFLFYKITGVVFKVGERL